MSLLRGGGERLLGRAELDYLVLDELEVVLRLLALLVHRCLDVGGDRRGHIVPSGLPGALVDFLGLRLNDISRLGKDLVALEKELVLKKDLGAREVLLVLEILRHLVVALNDGCEQEVDQQNIRRDCHYGHENEEEELNLELRCLRVSCEVVLLPQCPHGRPRVLMEVLKRLEHDAPAVDLVGSLNRVDDLVGICECDVNDGDEEHE